MSRVAGHIAMFKGRKGNWSIQYRNWPQEGDPCDKDTSIQCPQCKKSQMCLIRPGEKEDWAYLCSECDVKRCNIMKGMELLK